MMPIAYVTLGTNDPDRARPFWEALASALGGGIVQEVPGRAFCCELGGGGRIWVTRPFDGAPASIGNGVTVGLAVDGTGSVDRAHAAGLAAGGSDEGAPGPRPQYGPGIYVGYLRDPDGNKLALAHAAPPA